MLTFTQCVVGDAVMKANWMILRTTGTVMVVVKDSTAEDAVNAAWNAARSSRPAA